MNNSNEHRHESLTLHLFVRFKIIYGAKWTNNFDEDTTALAMIEWSAATANMDIGSLTKVIDHCKLNLEWPPSIAEFIGFSEQEAGTPSLEAAFNAAIRRDFQHPLINYVYNKIGSWAMSHDSEKDLRAKFKIAYNDAIKLRRNINLRQIANDGAKNG